MVVQHTIGFQSLSFEIFSFLLTLLAVTITPMFVLSEHWSHLPCGCIINCRKNVYTVSSEEGKSKYRKMRRALSVMFHRGLNRWHQIMLNMATLKISHAFPLFCCPFHPSQNALPAVLCFSFLILKN